MSDHFSREPPQVVIELTSEAAQGMVHPGRGSYFSDHDDNLLDVSLGKSKGPLLRSGLSQLFLTATSRLSPGGTHRDGSSILPHRQSSPKSPVITTRSYINDAAQDNDFDAIREGLSFALGSENGRPGWFPVSEKSVEKSPEKPLHKSATIDLAPTFVTGKDHFTDNIPLQNLRPLAGPAPSPMSRKDSFLSPFRDASMLVKSPKTLEEGLMPTAPPMLNSPSSFGVVLARLSDRIAGTGTGATPVAETPPENPLTKDPTPPSSPSRDSAVSPSKDKKSSPLKTAISPTAEPFSSSKKTTTPLAEIFDEVASPLALGPLGAAHTPLADGLGLYLKNTHETADSTSLRDHFYDSMDDLGRVPSATQAPLTHALLKERKIGSHTSSDALYLFGKSLKLFSPQSWFRQGCHKLISHHLTNVGLLVLLILQVFLLSYRQWNPIKLQGYFYAGYNWADYVLIVINFIYTVEVLAKVVAYGFIDDDVMFIELGLRAPDQRTDYLQKTFFNKVLRKLGIGLVSSRKPPILDQKQPYFSDRGSSSDELDVKEISLDDIGFPKKPARRVSEGPLIQKYDGSQYGLSTEPVVASQRFDVKNTLLLQGPRTKIDELLLKRAYLRNSWHRIDFVSMVMFWISLALSVNHYDAKHHIMLFRALSCLRILRLCNLTTGTTTILRACKVAIPQLIDVAIFICCFWLFFGIIGVQSFKSSFTRQCVWTNPRDASDTWINSGQYCGSYIGPDGRAMAYLNRDGSSSNMIKGFRCPQNSKCVSGENPYGGTVNFDNILQSLELVFVVMSANTFTDLMYDTMDSDNVGACLFFIFCIFILTVWLINIFIAVIVASFKVTRLEAAEERKREREGKRTFKIFGSVEHDVSMHQERIDALKKQNMFLRVYYNFEFLFVLVIVADLFAQCFRKYEMTNLRRHALYHLEVVFTIVFAVEILLRLAFHLPKWRLFFVSKRNCFDLFLAIITSVIIIGPVKDRLGHGYYWLTVFQIMRFYRVVLATSITRKLWLKIMGNFKSIFDLALFYFILLYLVSIILARYFEGAIPVDALGDVDIPMHTLPNSFIGLYVISSTENWTEVLYTLQQYAPTTSNRSFGAILLISWFIISNMVVLNIFIAVIANTLEVLEEGKRKQQLLQFISDMTVKLQSIDSEAGLLSKVKKRLFRSRRVKEDLERAVVNLLLSGSAVNDFLDRDEGTGAEGTDTEGEDVRHLSRSKWKRFFQVNFWRTTAFFENPFYLSKAARKHDFSNFDPANFAKNIITERNQLITKQNNFLKQNPRFNDVFYVLTPRHPLRRFCQRIVRSSHGERIDGVEPSKPISEIFVVIMFLATIGLVVTACYLTPLYRKEMLNRYGNINWTFYLEVAFNILFTTEFFIRVFADGLIFTPNAYMRSSWNLIDLLVLVSLWIEFIAFLRNDGNLSRIVRGLKALRALRLLTISETAKNNFHNTLISGFWKIINAAVISLCLLFPFSIWGLNVFNGRLGYCLDGLSFMGECINEYQNNVFNWNVMSPNVYTNPPLEFNRFETALATLFEIVSLEGWADLLLNVMKSTGVGSPQEDYATPFNGFFVMLFNFVSTIFILTLFVSVIISNYSITTGRAYLTSDQQSWYQVKKFLTQVKPSKRRDPAELSAFRKFCYRMTVEKDVYWNHTLNAVLMLHVIVLLMESFPTHNALTTVRNVAFLVSASTFLANGLMLLCAQGLRTYVAYKWNLFSFFVSFGAVITTIISYFISQHSIFTNINKLFLVGMLAFVIPRSNRLSQLLRFASASLPALISLSFTWVVVFLVFAIALNQIFGLTKVGPNGSGNLNLRSVPKSLIVLFRCSFGEGWNYIMNDYTLEAPFCTAADSLDESDCGNKQYAYILFIAWNLLSMYIFLNMFISLILDSFSYINNRSSYSHLIKREEIRKFKKVWQRFDPQGTGFIRPFDLPKVLHSLEGSLSFHFYSGSLEIPTLCKKWIKRNNAGNPYDVTVNFAAVEETLNSMDVPKIRARRRAYEQFMEEAIVSMEMNGDPGISFSRILTQLPLYNAFEAGQCLNLIDFLERRLLLQKVVKRLHTKRVYETIAAYSCRWKYRKNQKQGIKDTDIDFGKELRRNSYLANEELAINTPSILVTDTAPSHDAVLNYDDSYDGVYEEGERYPLNKLSGFAGFSNDEDATTSGVYVPKSPVNIYKARNRSDRPQNMLSQTKELAERLRSLPKLYIQIPSSGGVAVSSGTASSQEDLVLHAESASEAHLSEDNVSLIDVATVGETLENTSWGDALREVQSDRAENWTVSKEQ